MKTLIELYDERPIENVLASEVFRPERTVFLCPAEIAQDRRVQEKLRKYFMHRGLDMELVFLESSIYNSGKLLKQLRSVCEKYGDCMMDITGGTDAALFAGGLLCAGRDIPVFTYSRRRNRFFNIHDAAFADELPCTVLHDVEDCILMAGGAARMGRVDNDILAGYMDRIDPFFALYLRFRTRWTKIVNYIQLASQAGKDSLYVEAAPVLAGNRGAKVNVPKDCLSELEKIGFLRDARFGNPVTFSFRDLQVRTWLRDIGSVLELYIYKVCLDTGIFNDVRTSVIVSWDGDMKQPEVTNEIDVMAMKGVTPVFISCKTCEISTEALNELAILRDRFGGNGAKAAIVTAKSCRAITRQRAAELDIEVIDLGDLKAGRAGQRLKSLTERD